MTMRPGYGIPAWGDAGGAGYLRASTADRERAIDVLKAGFVEGRLDKDEYDARVSAAYAARTYADLAEVTGDLPGGQVMAPVPVPPWRPVAPAPRTNPLAIASLVFGLAQPFTLGLTTIPAVVLGHVAHGQIRRSGERGDALATVGLVLGWIGISVLVLLMLVVAIVVRHSGTPAPPGVGGPGS
jgi:Domain of unknown function (DUF1707)/Domain of unknown function (DUF4190)